MRILSINLNNFRQFHGKHHLDLSTTDGKNVVVIHGENGAGKTTLLNAFKWCFYGETDFDTGTEKLLNEQALVETTSGGKIEMMVAVEFEHELMRYTATRAATFKQTGPTSFDIVGEALRLTWIDASGSFQKTEKPDMTLRQILPPRMHPYFFFNGERIEKLARANAADEVKAAVKNLMGLEIVERAISHVSGPVLARLRKEMKDNSPKELQDVIENESILEEKISELRIRISQIDKNVIQYKAEIQAINRKLESNQAVAAKQNERAQLEKDVAELEERLLQLKKQRFEYISSYGGLAFAGGFIATASKILEESRQKGELPFKVKEQFITDLLEKGKCICDRDLSHGTPAYDAVNVFRQATTSHDVETAFIETSGTLIHLERSREAMFGKLTGFQKDEASINAERSSRLDRIAVLGSEIGQNRDSEDIPKLENKRGEFTTRITESSEQKGNLQEELRVLDIQRADLEKQRIRLSAQSEKNAGAAKHFELAEEVKRVLDALYAALAEQVRTRLSSTVYKTFGDIMRKQYWAEIDANYTLQIFKKVGDEKQLVYEKSTGESQIASLCFIASIVDMAKARAEEKKNLSSGVFPIVMDSPFGALDPDYRQKIAEFIPQLADQVIVLVSESQWSKEVAEQVRPRMAQEYTLRYSTPQVTDETDLTKVHKSERFETTQIEEGHYVD